MPLLVTIPLPSAPAGGEYGWDLWSADGGKLRSSGSAPPALLPSGDDLVLAVPAAALSWHEVTLPQGSTNSPVRLRSVLAGLLVVWGIAATIGNLVGGAVSDGFCTRWAIIAGLVLLGADFVLLPWSSATILGAATALAVWGVCGWGFLVPQQHRLVSVAGDSAPFALALNAAAIYLAVALSGITGALGITALGAHWLGPASATLIILGLVAAASLPAAAAAATFASEFTHSARSGSRRS